MIDKAGDLKVNLSLDNLLSYDKELGEITLENRTIFCQST